MLDDSANDSSPGLRRSDAQRNREAILVAASAAFDELGLHVPSEQIARRAGVGSATLHRHFPTRQQLVETVFSDYTDSMIQGMEEALAIDDPWESFATMLEQLFAMQASHRGFSDLMTIRFPGMQTLAGGGGRPRELTEVIISRAQQAGALRPDFSGADMPPLLWANARIIEATRKESPDVWQRFLGFTLDALRAHSAQPARRPPLTPDQVRASMLALGREVGVPE